MTEFCTQEMYLIAFAPLSDVPLIYVFIVISYILLRSYLHRISFLVDE